MSSCPEQAIPLIPIWESIKTDKSRLGQQEIYSGNTMCCHTVVAKEGARASERERGVLLIGFHSAHGKRVRGRRSKG